MRLSPNALPPLALAVALGGCVGPTRDIWGEHGGHVATRDPRPATRATPRAMRGRAQARRDAADVAFEVENGLLRFAARRRGLGAELSSSPGAWPPAMTSTWTDLLVDLERAFDVSDGPLPSRVLVQTRVTLEAELELTERRFGRAPEALSTRVRTLYVQVARQLRASRGRPDPDPHVARGRAGFIWPVSPVVITSPFGFRRDPILGAERVRFHAGVDLGGRRGDVVVSAGPGRVVAAGWQGGHGRTVTVQHPGGLVTRYAHLSRILVPLHSEVDAGSPVGLMGSTGRSTGPHLHFEVKRGSVPVDPLELVGFSAGYARR